MRSVERQALKAPRRWAGWLAGAVGEDLEGEPVLVQMQGAARMLAVFTGAYAR